MKPYLGKTFTCRRRNLKVIDGIYKNILTLQKKGPIRWYNVEDVILKCSVVYSSPSSFTFTTELRSQGVPSEGPYTTKILDRSLVQRSTGGLFNDFRLDKLRQPQTSWPSIYLVITVLDDSESRSCQRGRYLAAAFVFSLLILQINPRRRRFLIAAIDSGFHIENESISYETEIEWKVKFQIEWRWLNGDINWDGDCVKLSSLHQFKVQICDFRAKFLALTRATSRSNRRHITSHLWSRQMFSKKQI